MYAVRRWPKRLSAARMTVLGDKSPGVRKRATGTRWIRGCVDPGYGLDALEKKEQHFNPSGIVKSFFSCTALNLNALSRKIFRLPTHIHKTLLIAYLAKHYKLHTAELQLSGRWLSVSPIIRIGLAVRINIFLPELNCVIICLKFPPPPNCRIHKELCINVLFARK